MGNPVSESREKVSDSRERAARQLARGYAERAVRTLVEVAKGERSSRARVVAAKAILRRDTSWADQKIAIESLVEVMDKGKSVGAQVAAAQEILRIAYGPPRAWRQVGDGERDQPAVALRPQPAAAVTQRALWRERTALASGTVALPR